MFFAPTSTLFPLNKRIVRYINKLDYKIKIVFNVNYQINKQKISIKSK